MSPSGSGRRSGAWRRRLDERLAEAIAELGSRLDERRDRELEATREAVRGELERAEAELARLRIEGEAAIAHGHSRARGQR